MMGDEAQLFISFYSFSSLAGNRATLRTIRQDDFHGTKWRLVGIWESRTKTPLLNKNKGVRGGERTSLLVLSSPTVSSEPMNICLYTYCMLRPSTHKPPSSWSAKMTKGLHYSTHTNGKNGNMTPCSANNVLYVYGAASSVRVECP